MLQRLLLSHQLQHGKSKHEEDKQQVSPAQWMFHANK